jgi:hypothetical protein
MAGVGIGVKAGRADGCTGEWSFTVLIENNFIRRDYKCLENYGGGEWIIMFPSWFYRHE